MMETIIIGGICVLVTGLVAALICKNNMRVLRESYERQITALKENHERETASLKENHEKQLADADRRIGDADRQWQLRFDRLKEEILNLNNALLIARQEKLQDANRSQMAELLQPVKDQFEAFKKSVEETRTAPFKLFIKK